MLGQVNGKPQAAPDRPAQRRRVRHLHPHLRESPRFVQLARGQRRGGGHQGERTIFPGPPGAVRAPTRQVLVRHVLPNIVAPLIIVFSINVGGVILAEASLNFLGFGLPIKVPSWGGMLSREGRRFMAQAPWQALWPGLCLTIVVYSFNMLGDAMRACSIRGCAAGGVWLPAAPRRSERWTATPIPDTVEGG